MLGFGWVRFRADPDGLAGPCMAGIWCMVIGLMWCSCVSRVESRGGEVVYGRR